MWDFNRPYFDGKLIAAHEAWRRLDEWSAAREKIGAWYVAKSGPVRTLGVVKAARQGRLELRSPAGLATFNLKSAKFAYYPTPFYPRWPMGPAVNLMALHAFLESGEWLMLAEGLRAEELPGLKAIGPR